MASAVHTMKYVHQFEENAALSDIHDYSSQFVQYIADNVDHNIANADIFFDKLDDIDDITE